MLLGLHPTGYGRHVTRVADIMPHDDHRRAAFSGGKFHDF
jgi:hypothetical protein